MIHPLGLILAESLDIRPGIEAINTMSESGKNFCQDEAF
jgi:hypothetical protein